MKPVMPVSLSLLFLVLLLAGCGSNTSTTASSTSTTSTLAAATATACAQTRSQRTLKTASGTLKSSSGSTLLIATQQGTSVTVTYSSTTRFTRQSIVPASSLKEGTFVTVLVTSTNNSYAATRISITNGTGNGQFPGRGTGANNPCFSQARRSGTPGSGQFGGTNGNGNGAGTGTGNFRGLIGTVSQLNGNVLSVSDTSGANFTVTITPQTQIMETSNVTAAALKTGMALVVSGTAGSQGAINARTVSIVSKLPTRQPPQTPTPAQS